MDSLVEKGKVYAARYLLMVMGLFLKSEKKAIFNSFSGKQYSDSPRAISEKLHELYPDYKIVWVWNQKEDIYGVIPDYVKTVRSGTWEYYKEFATSCAFACNIAMIPCFYKRKDQFFIQTWHGDRAFKKVLYEAAKDDGEKPWVPITDRRDTDLCIAGSQGGIARIRRSFLYEGEILALGMPRNDRLVIRDPENEKKVRQRLGLEEDAKVFLYAPTFRDNSSDDQDIFVDLHEVIAHLEQTGQKWVCLIRSHSLVGNLRYDYDGKKFINVSRYPDMADLLAIADFLMTDYSSSAGDYVLRRKPLILAAFDKEMYIKNCRRFAIDIEEPGFIVAKSQEESIRILDEYTPEDYAASCEKVLRFYGEQETGKSAEAVCHRIDAFYRSLGRE